MRRRAGSRLGGNAKERCPNRWTFPRPVLRACFPQLGLLFMPHRASAYDNGAQKALCNSGGVPRALEELSCEPAAFVGFSSG